MASNSNGKSSVNERSALCALSTTLTDPTQNFTHRYDAVRSYLDTLAKPVGSLGSLEDFAARIAAAQCCVTPKVTSPVCLIFAADHGVAKDVSDGGMNCSAYPQAVSRKVLEGLDHGIAGASVLARANDVALRVVDVGLADGPTLPRFPMWSNRVVHTSDSKIAGGTKNFCRGDAMSDEEVQSCILAGRKETGNFLDEQNGNVVIFGEVGIGNTTTSSALIALLTGTDVESLCGTGASTTRDGINDDAIAKKVSIINEAMQYHGGASSLKGAPLKALRSVGGAEIAAMVGGMLESSERNVPILVDGFIVTTAAMIACLIDPKVARLLIFATKSTEKGQVIALNTIHDIATSNHIPPPAMPALNMQLRMGEGTGALLAVPLVKSACAMLAELATLQEVLGLEM